jgi:hypothetical protein
MVTPTLDSMFTYKKNGKVVFIMAGKSLSIPEIEFTSMQNKFTSIDNLYVYAYEYLSRKKLSDFSMIDSTLIEKTII